MIALLNVYEHPNADQVLYALLRERSTEHDEFVNISHRKLPTFTEHVKFMDSRPYRYWYLIGADSGKPVGTCYISKRNEIGIVLFQAQRGKGYGTEAVKAL